MCLTMFARNDDLNHILQPYAKSNRQPLECRNPALFVAGFDGGVWFAVREGIRGILVQDEKGGTRVYPVCEPASHYYKVMTRSEWMPVLVKDRRGAVSILRLNRPEARGAGKTSVAVEYCMPRP